MRGKDGDSVHSRLPFRITPAYAGKRNLNRNAEKARKDHPRLCGEKIKLSHNNFLHMGSPPPMRGKAFCNAGGDFLSGITPAYAGKSNSSDTRLNMN